MESASDESNYGVEEANTGVEWLADSSTIPLDASEHDHMIANNNANNTGNGIEMSRTTYLKAQIDRLESQEHHLHHVSEEEDSKEAVVVVVNDIALTSDNNNKKDLNIRKRS